jgi:hypothetical protein
MLCLGMRRVMGRDSASRGAWKSSGEPFVLVDGLALGEVQPGGGEAEDGAGGEVDHLSRRAGGRMVRRTQTVTSGVGTYRVQAIRDVVLTFSFVSVP